MKTKRKKNEKRGKYFDFTRELKEAVEHEGDGDTNYSWCTWNGRQRRRKGTWRIGNQRTSIAEIS